MNTTQTIPQVPDTVDALIDQFNKQEAASAPAQPEPAVLDVNLFDKEQRAVQYLQYAGLLAGNDDVTALNFAKVLNHAVFADETIGNVPQLQDQFRATMVGAQDVSQLAEGGVESPAFKLVDGVLAARIAQAKKTIEELDALPSTLDSDEFNRARKRGEAKVSKYEKERAYNQGNPDVINNIVREHPEVLTVGKYLPIGRLAIETGLIKGDKAVAMDMVDDTLANAAAHSLLHVAEEVMSTSDADLATNKRFPDRYRANIMAKATDTAATTTAIEDVRVFDDATPELARIQAMKNLLSAHLHEMTRHTRDADGNSNPPIAQLAEALTQVKPLVREYQRAAMSLAYHFLGEGAGKDDARMQKLREHLAGMMEKNKIPLMMNKAEAERAADALVEKSAAFLRGKEAKAIANIDALVRKATAAKVISMAERYANAPAASFAQAAERPATAIGLGQ